MQKIPRTCRLRNMNEELLTEHDIALIRKLAGYFEQSDLQKNEQPIEGIQWGYFMDYQGWAYYPSEVLYSYADKLEQEMNNEK